jgi:hypothetical protein
MSETIKLTENDTLPSITITVSRSGTGSTTPNLTNHTAYMKVRKQGNSTNKFTLAVTSSGNDDGQITYPTSGIVRFDWTGTTDRWNTTGIFLGEASFASSAGYVETCPDKLTFIVASEY